MDTLNDPPLFGTDSETLTIAAPMFVHETFLPRFAAQSEGKIRCLALPPALLTAYARERLFGAAITIGGDLGVPEAWSRIHVGDVRYGLFGSPAVAKKLGPVATLDDILAVPFVGPVFVSRRGELAAGQDRCPVPRAERRIGHEAESVGLAFRIASETEHLVYGPAAAAVPFMIEGTLVELPVAGWSQTDPLYLACDDEAVPLALQEALGAAIKAAFATLRFESGVVEVVDVPQSLRARSS